MYIMLRIFTAVLKHWLVYAADVNILGGSIHPITKNTEALVITSIIKC
jgi:hypothetical protein